MLFNKKMLMAFCNITGVLLVLNFLFNIAMYVWAFFGVPPLPMFDISSGLTSYYILLFREATLVFYYLMVGVAAGLIKSSKLQEGFRK